MGLKRTYQIICDGCGTGGNMQSDSPRRARAIAKRDGWARRKIKVGEYESRDWEQDDSGKWHRTDRTRMVDELKNRDFCPRCLITYQLPELEAPNAD